MWNGKHSHLAPEVQKAHNLNPSQTSISEDLDKRIMNLFNVTRGVYRLEATQYLTSLYNQNQTSPAYKLEMIKFLKTLVKVQQNTKGNPLK